MKKEQPSPEAFLPLTPAVLHIMLALLDGERHGYSIMQEVTLRTGGKVRMGPGTLYGSIKRMIADGLIEESAERPDPALDDERRRYYRLTNLGQRVMRAEVQRLEQIVHLARSKQIVTGSEMME
ncbi:MAG: helix-turn-helix transcriptional regulator [Chloroflexi bacterium]|nr:MAG: helix-turn-helix transcriptional regulator [Chloroflexota bacterium]